MALFGIPVSTTHAISSAIMGVGATKRLSAVRRGTGKRIIYAWIVTIPASAAVAAKSYCDKSNNKYRWLNIIRSTLIIAVQVL
jgi:phosphate/sulfate permease